jgi:hypothetical protein
MRMTLWKDDCVTGTEMQRRLILHLDIALAFSNQVKYHYPLRAGFQ